MKSGNLPQTRRTRNHGYVLPFLVALQNLPRQRGALFVNAPMLEDSPHTILCISCLLYVDTAIRLVRDGKTKRLPGESPRRYAARVHCPFDATKAPCLTYCAHPSEKAVLRRRPRALPRRSQPRPACGGAHSHDPTTLRPAIRKTGRGQDVLAGLSPAVKTDGTGGFGTLGGIVLNGLPLQANAPGNGGAGGTVDVEAALDIKLTAIDGFHVDGAVQAMGTNGGGGGQHGGHITLASQKNILAVAATVLKSSGGLRRTEPSPLLACRAPQSSSRLARYSLTQFAPA